MTCRLLALAQLFEIPYLLNIVLFLLRMAPFFPLIC